MSRLKALFRGGYRDLIFNMGARFSALVALALAVGVPAEDFAAVAAGIDDTVGNRRRRFDAVLHAGAEQDGHRTANILPAAARVIHVHL